MPGKFNCKGKNYQSLVFTENISPFDSFLKPLISTHTVYRSILFGAQKILFKYYSPSVFNNNNLLTKTI